MIYKYGNHKLVTNPHILVLCIFFFALQMAVFFFGIWFITSCYGSGTVYKDTKIGYPYKIYRLPWYSWVALIYLFISWIWVFVFMNNLGDYMTSAIVVEDYFKAKGGFRGLCGAICNTLVYHLGSVALASVVLFPSAIMQALFGWLYDLTSKTGDEQGPPNKAQVIFSKICCCLMWPYKKLFMRVGEQGFPMGYVSSANFCPSSKEAYYLLLTYSNILGDVGFVNFLYRLTGSLAIAFMNTGIAYLVFKYLPYYAEKLQSPIPPCVVVLGDQGHLHSDPHHRRALHVHSHHRD